MVTKQRRAVVRIPSLRWQLTGLACAVAGLVAGIASLLLLRVETPPAGRGFSITQDILGLLAFTGLLGFVSAGLLAGVALGRRPAAEADRSGVKVFGWRAVRVPWPMISEVTTVREGKGIRPALLLANGQVLPLRFAGQVASDDAETLGLLDAALLRYHRKQRAKARGRWAAKPSADVPGPFVRRDLPGQVVFGVPRPRFPRWSRGVAVGVPVLLVGLKLLAALTKGYSFDAGQLVLAFAVVAGAAAVAVTIAWATWTSDIAIGEDWIGWRSRTGRHWRVLPFSDIVSITTATRKQLYHSLVIKRADGRGIEIRESALRAGAAAALLPSLAGHPGLDPAANDVLTWAPTAGPVEED
jgi:hypothetical protein